MLHKRGPVAAVSAATCAAQALGLARIPLAAMAHEHEVPGGAWQADWRPLRELFIAAGSAVSWLQNSLTGLAVDQAAMAANLSRLHAALGAEPGVGVAGQLVDRALAAHDDRSSLTPTAFAMENTWSRWQRQHLALLTASIRSRASHTHDRAAWALCSSLRHGLAGPCVF